MKAFAAGELHLLVATTVVEVGIDVPNANADRGRTCGAVLELSQLHQLRGRVGRDRHQSYCFCCTQSPL